MPFDGGRPQPAVRLRSRPGAAAVGASKLGGAPDVRSGFAWPQRAGRPLQFLAQVNLADVARFPCASDLPSSGLLSFFYDAAEMPWGFDPKDRGSWVVRYEGDAAAFRSMEPPADAFVECVLEASEVETLPPDDQEEGGGEDGPQHRLLGHPSPIQGEMELECQLASNGVYVGDPSGYEGPRAKALAAGAADWRLLLQLDSDDDAAMMWGDLGRLYFWITGDALRRRAFDECWMVLQCS